MAVTHDIVAKLWNLCNVLKDDGVTYHQYVTELTYLLFLKMAEETEQEAKLRQAAAVCPQPVAAAVAAVLRARTREALIDSTLKQRRY